MTKLPDSGVARRSLPSVERLLTAAGGVALIDRFGRPMVVAAMRVVIAEQRLALASGHAVDSTDDEVLIERCGDRVRTLHASSLRPVFNLSGTVLHTNLGRALLPQSAVDAAVAAMTRPVNLEYDVESGVRGNRDSHVRDWLVRLTGAADAIVVNNNAAAVYLALNSLCLRKEVIVSRGELVEIGGSFRIPDIMARAGCRLREVGTTNRTHLRDFTDAVGPRTAAIMKVHASNYTISGFTASVSLPELAAVAHEHGLPLLDDLGSGTLVDLEEYGLPHEPTPRQALGEGADIVTFSGDKLLGGPQCGIIAGGAEYIARIAKNPMCRALRIDKVRLAALEAVLRLYGDPARLTQELPTLRLLTRTRADIAAQARRIIPAVTAALAPRWRADIVDCSSQIGSGALPVDTLPSAGISLSLLDQRRKQKRSGVAALAAAFRRLPVPVIGHVRDEALIFDLRCLEHDAEFAAQLGHLNLSQPLSNGPQPDASLPPEAGR